MERSAKHLKFIRSLPCCYCSRQENIHAAHLRAGLPMDKKGGVGLKPCDSCTVPLCAGCHQRQHKIGELSFWGDMAKPYELSQALWKFSGDVFVCLSRIKMFRSGLRWGI